ncbi:MAG: serine/threonine protein kinase [Myxococcaceae bacterium]|nr:serine/threonine protein kinase [Myxococcaceae bacterium]MEA2748299.1 eukaryotic-like serine/threonine-protein kinase [Myxococcales bacterium]
MTLGRGTSLLLSGLRHRCYASRQVAEQSSADYRGSLGRYALYGEIAAGGMATVHLARLLGPVGFARTVAIKRLHPHLAKDPDFVAMFLEEARLAARVRHPNVVATLDVVSDDGELFLVMEYVAGESLSRLVRKARERGERVPPRYAIGIVSGALEGLHSAHDAKSEKGQALGLVHRDVSPQNVHVGVDGVPRLLDFGIAKATNRVQETRTDQIKGKVAYMSPEQLAKGAIDRRADVYSAAVVLWETLTGERLFKADDVPSLVYAIINEEVRKPSEIVPDLPRGLDAVVMKGLEREAENRWSSAREMAAALEEVLQPAPAREIGEWVHSVAGDALDWRQELVHRIESETSSSIPPPMIRRDSPVPREVTSGVVATADDDGRDQAPTISNEDRGADERETLLAPSHRTPAPSVLEHDAHELDDEGEHARPSIGLVAMALGGLVFVVAGVLFGMRWVSTDPTAAAAPATSASVTTPSESESAIVIGESQRNAPAAAVTQVQPQPQPQPQPAPTAIATTVTRPRGNPTTAPAVPPHDECDNPFTVDARGIRHPKPQCFNKK